jgi:lipopolysaccharide/colanic/teichoic acid biosynthesis glycosyltransferase
LLIVGSFESQDPIPAETEVMLREDPRIHLAGRVDDTSNLYAAMDILALPSYREGFGLVAVEAAAMAVPVVATRVPGCIDAVEDGVTGTLVPAYDGVALREAISRYLKDSELRRAHGQAGRARVERDFQPEAIWEALHVEYVRLLKEKRLISEAEESKHARSMPGKTSYRFRLSRAIKAAVDFGAALMGLVVLSPLLAMTAVLVRVYLGSPVLFKQERPGFKGRPFNIYKFRTMSDALDSHGKLLPDDKRLNRLGSFLRGSSLDELPELFNVLKGEMSLVGPRPLRMEYLDRYTSEQARRHDVKPGITGWAQVNGRNALAWDDRFAFDVWYVDNWSLWLDIKICFLTIFKVLKQEGISAEGHVTMPEFLGSERD